MKIEALETIKSHGLVLAEGDIVSVDDAAGQAFCAAGWARDVEGKVATGERLVMGVAVSVQAGKTAQEATNG